MPGGKGGVKAKRANGPSAAVPFGPADDQARAAIAAISDVERLEELGKSVRGAANWQELLGLPAPRRRNGQRKPGRR
jgi:hypothetical protein